LASGRLSRGRAPKGYSPLLALNGPVGLSARHTAQIVTALGDGPTDSVAIGVAITKAINRLPSNTQTRAIAAAIHRVHVHPADDRRKPL